MKGPSKWQSTLIVATLACSTAAPALAAPQRSKFVAVLITAAQKEFDAANFERAGDLFLDIWREDKEARAALYNAARAYHLAGKLDKAEELYAEFLALPDVDASTLSKVQGQQADIRAKRADQKADTAARAEGAGDYRLAVALWGDAIRLNDAKPAWHLRYARALHLDGQKDAALGAYDRYLAQVPADTPERAQARAWRDEVAPALTVTAAPRDQPAAAPRPAIAAMVTLGAGILALASGVTLLGLAAADEGELNARLARTDAAGKVRDLSLTEATSEAQRIESQYQIGWVCAGLGAIGAGVGTYLWLGPASSNVAVSPLPSGLRVAIRF